MKTSVSRKQRFFNQIHLTENDDLYIGIDVHKVSYHVAFYLNGTHAIDFVTPADNAKLCTILQKLKPAIKDIVYEAAHTSRNYLLKRQDHFCISSTGQITAQFIKLALKRLFVYCKG